MPDEPIGHAELPGGDDFEERFRRAHDELHGFETVPDPLESDYEKRLRKALEPAPDSKFELSDEQIAQRAAQMESEVSNAAHPQLPDTADFNARLDSLQKRTQEARGRHEARVADETRRRRLDGEGAQGAGLGLSVAYMIIGTPLVGAGIGWLIDRRLGIDLWKGIGMLVGATGGVILALVTLKRRSP